MTRDEISDLLAQRLNNRTDLVARINSELVLAQSMRLEQNGLFYPWFLVTEYSAEMTEMDENRVPIPSDFLSEIEDVGLWVQNEVEEWVPLVKGDEDDLMSRLGSTSGRPTSYALIGEHFSLFPIPDDNYTIRMRYYAAQPALTSNIENGWTKYAADLLIAEVGEAIAAFHMQNPALAAEFTKSKAAAWARLGIAHEARIHANREYTMGGN